MKILLVPVALLLAACGAGASPTVTVTAEERVVTVTAPPPVEAPTEVTVRSLLESSGFYYPGPDSDLESVSQSICDAIDSGVSPTTIGAIAMDSGFNADEAAAIVAASIVVKCPWNQNTV